MSGSPDDSHVNRLLTRHKKAQLSQLFSAPLQTPCKFQIVPFVGQRVAFFHTRSQSEEYRIRAEFQFDSADVSFAMATRGKKEDILQWVLSPVMSRIEHRGAPVFNAEAKLVGVMRETVLLDGEAAWRPIISAVLPLHGLLAGPSA